VIPIIVKDCGWPLSLVSVLFESPAPFLRIHISKRFRKHPLMTRQVLCHVLPLAKLEIGGFHDDARSAFLGVLAMSPGVFDTNHDLMGDFALVRRSSVRADITNNHGPIANLQLRAMVFTNLQTFLKAECLT